MRIGTGPIPRMFDHPDEPGYFQWWHPYYRLAVRMHVRPEDEAGPQLRALGIPPEEVRWIVMTHLHSDHAGGLAHFPKAEFLVSPLEYRNAAGHSGVFRGYLPQHWPSWFAPTLVQFVEAPFDPFPQSFSLTKAGDVLLVPTEGHTSGHMSVIVREDDRVVLIAGDTSYNQLLMLDESVDGVSPDEEVSRQTLQRIKGLARQVPTVYLPSHDSEAFERLAQRQSVQFPDL